MVSFSFLQLLNSYILFPFRGDIVREHCFIDYVVFVWDGLFLATHSVLCWACVAGIHGENMTQVDLGDEPR